MRKDRVRVGGGVAAFIKRDLLVSEVIIDNTFAELELQCFDFVAGAKSKLRFFVVYRPPNYDVSAKNYSDLLIGDTVLLTIQTSLLEILIYRKYVGVISYADSLWLRLY